VDLVDRLGASHDGAALGQSQHADRLDRAITAFGSRGRLACEHGEGSVDSIDRIAVAEPTSTLPVWSHDLDHRHRTGGEITGHASVASAPACLCGLVSAPGRRGGGWHRLRVRVRRATFYGH